MDIKRAGVTPSAKVLPTGSPVPCVSTPCSVRPTPDEPAGPASPSNPARAPRGLPNPLGQTLIVTFGFGRVRLEGGPIEEIRPGDGIRFAPGEKHWHGASPTTAMTHIAIQEALDGKSAEWMEKVSDEQYGA